MIENMNKSITSLWLSLCAFLVSAGVVQANGEVNENVFGTINAPAGVQRYNTAAGGIGIVTFLSTLLRVSTVIAGIWVMINFIMAGWLYITSAGDTKAHTDASGKMTYSAIGLAIIIGSYTIAALIGLIFFGNPEFIINPTFEGI